MALLKISRILVIRKNLASFLKLRVVLILCNLLTNFLLKQTKKALV